MVVRLVDSVRDAKSLDCLGVLGEQAQQERSGNN